MTLSGTEEHKTIHNTTRCQIMSPWCSSAMILELAHVWTFPALFPITKYRLSSGRVASHGEDMWVVCSDHNQGVLRAGQGQSLVNGLLKGHGLFQGLHGLTIMVGMVYPPSYNNIQSAVCDLWWGLTKQDHGVKRCPSYLRTDVLQGLIDQSEASFQTCLYFLTSRRNIFFSTYCKNLMK